MGLLMYRLGLAHEKWGKESLADNLFAEAEKVLRITHGSEHELTERLLKKKMLRQSQVSQL